MIHQLELLVILDMYLLKKFFSLAITVSGLAILTSPVMAVPLFNPLSPQPAFNAPSAQPSLSQPQQSYYWLKPQNALWALVGTWYGEAMVDDKLNQKVVLERCRNGIFVVVSNNCYNKGKCVQRTHVGRWHARFNIYTTQILGEVRDMVDEQVYRESDRYAPEAHHQFKIAALSHHHLSYQSLETGRHLTMTKLNQPESVELCHRMSNIVMGH